MITMQVILKQIALRHDFCRNATFPMAKMVSSVLTFLTLEKRLLIPLLAKNKLCKEGQISLDEFQAWSHESKCL